MKTTIKAFAKYRDYIGKDCDLEISPGETIQTILNRLSKQHKGLHETLFKHDGQVINNVIILVNGRNINHLDKLNTPIGNSDIIAIFPPSAGG